MGRAAREWGDTGVLEKPREEAQRPDRRQRQLLPEVFDASRDDGR